MAGGRGRGSSKLVASGDEEDEFLYPSEVLESLWAPGSSSSFQGSKAMVNFESECGGEGTSKTFFHTVDKEESGEVEDYGGISFPLSGKKRRLTAGQVEFLERNFEVENKLEPERKVQLAKELGLQPRQVAIWFQNRRARFKTKQLEKDYDSLKACYDSLRDNHDSLLKEKEKLKLEVHSLRDKLLMRDEEKENTTSPEHLASLLIHRHECSFPKELPEILPDASSAKSDVLDSDSPNFPEPANSSHGFEPENSDEPDESSLHKSLLAPLLHLPKLEDGYHHDQPEDYACTFGLSCEEDQPFWRWPY